MSDAPKNQKTVVFFGITTWDYRFQRTQHLATRFADKGYQVFFVEPDFLVTKNQTTPPFELIQHAKNLYKVRLSGLKNLFIYSELPSNQNLAVMLKSFNRLVAGYQIKDLVAVVTHPFWTPLAKSINCPVIYDCMDYHAGFKENSRTVLEGEKELFHLADKVVVTSEFLRKQALGYTQAEKIYLIPNGGDYNHFSKELRPNSEEVVLGYIGAINDWFDDNVLLSLCQTHNQIELVGKVENRKVLRIVKQYPNLKILGEKLYADLPSTMNHWSICLIPFVINELTSATHPVKIYEYFATGKPVITTKLPELNNFKGLVYFVDKGADIKRLISQALNEDTKLALERKLVAKENDWEHRINQFEELL